MPQANCQIAAVGPISSLIGALLISFSPFLHNDASGQTNREATNAATTSQIEPESNASPFPDSVPLTELLQGNASFRMVLGRVALDTKRYRVGQFRFKKNDSVEATADKCLRTLTIALEYGEPNLVLYRSNDVERWMIEAKGNGRCKIQFTNSSLEYAITWDQPSHGLIELTLESKGHVEKFKVLSLWHLRFEHPEVCSQHVFPMLLKIEPNWNLELLASETESRMVDVLQVEPTVTERAVRELMEEFTSPNAMNRDKAHRRLRSLGLAILTPLMSADIDAMPAEQRMRIERLMNAMRPTTDDTPNRLAAWLAGDYAVCQSIAARMEGEAKLQGMAYLQGLSGTQSASIIR